MHHSAPLVAPSASPSRQRSRLRPPLPTSQNCELPYAAIYETTPPNTPHASNTLTNQSNLSGGCACTPSPSSPHTRGLYKIAWRMVGHVFSMAVCQVVSYFGWPHRAVSRKPRGTGGLGPRHCHTKKDTKTNRATQKLDPAMSIDSRCSTPPQNTCIHYTPNQVRL